RFNSKSDQHSAAQEEKVLTAVTKARAGVGSIQADEKP
ncbi:hypothetical protein LEP1GSC021_1821, partial [Leptospira noguchii str. 1993005606]